MPAHETADTYAYNVIDPARLDGVRTRRILAFLVDYAIVLLLCVPAAVIVAIVGIFTLGLLWLIFPVLGLVVALLYVGMTMGGPAQATIGMRMFAIRIQHDDGTTIDRITAIVHAIIFWVAHVTLTPILLIVSLFSTNKKLIQDILLGTVIVRSDY